MTAWMFVVVGQQRLVAADLLAELRVLLEDLVALQGGELAELQPDDGLGLGLGHVVLGGAAELALERGERLGAERPLQHARRRPPCPAAAPSPRPGSATCGRCG